MGRRWSRRAYVMCAECGIGGKKERKTSIHTNEQREEDCLAARDLRRKKKMYVRMHGPMYGCTDPIAAADMRALATRTRRRHHAFCFRCQRCWPHAPPLAWGRVEIPGMKGQRARDRRGEAGGGGDPGPEMGEGKLNKENRRRKERGQSKSDGPSRPPRDPGVCLCVHMWMRALGCDRGWGSGKGRSSRDSAAQGRLGLCLPRRERKEWMYGCMDLQVSMSTRRRTYRRESSSGLGGRRKGKGLG